jgi:hypothetical protein
MEVSLHFSHVVCGEETVSTVSRGATITGLWDRHSASV